ncbi:MAG: polyphosphate polymerase domain-containing protein [Burkholderiales bacterium]|nr:polyphosphate polymerase domain-containing protein [Burkholderiales bacterium]
MTRDKENQVALPERLDDVLIERSDFTAFAPGRTALNFGRFEYKYLVPESVRRRLEDAVSQHMVLDSYCAGMPESRYSIRSVYFDDLKFSCYHEKIDGLLNRRKFRVRAYGANATTIFLEEKGRRNAFSYKQRVVMPPELYGAVMRTDWKTLLAQLPGDSRVWECFISAGMRAVLRPTVRVDYMRRAYVNNSGYRFRVTFDSGLRAVQSADLQDRGARSRPVHPGMTVVEIKFESQIPLWFIRQVEANSLQRISISKYCACAEALELVTAEDPV